jgi:hypothetical protein
VIVCPAAPPPLSPLLQTPQVSVYEEDEEALAIWRDVVGVHPSRIRKMGAADNFWASGPTGGTTWGGGRSVVLCGHLWHFSALHCNPATPNLLLIGNIGAVHLFVKGLLILQLRHASLYPAVLAPAPPPPPPPHPPTHRSMWSMQ